MQEGNGKHAAEFFVQIEPEFSGGLGAGSVRRLRATKMTQTRPQMKQGAAYVKVRIMLDDATWRRVVPEAVIDVPLGSVGVIEVESEPIPAGPAETEEG